jgi:Methyltransferase domain
MNCRLCQTLTEKSFEKVILKKYPVSYYSCPQCGYFQTEKPYWLEEAYSNVINDEDLGIFRRNFFLSNFLMIWFLFKNKSAIKFLDYSGGYGILVRFMRDRGFNFKWTDKYCENIFAKNFEANLSADKFQFITSFEVIEHVESPQAFMSEILSYGGESILLSTIPFNGSLPQKDWFYLGENHGQHIGFFSQKSLSFLAEKMNLHLVTFRNMHLFSKKKHSKIYFFLCYVLAFFGIPQVIYLITRKKSLE